MKKRVALFMVGGIGVGIASQGYPAITAIVGALTEEFRISVYSLLPADPTFRPHGFSFRSPPRWLAGRSIRKLRWSWLASQFLLDHSKDPYDVLFSFWGYPMGLFAVSLAKMVKRPSVVALLGAETAKVPSIGYGYLQRPIVRRLVLTTCAAASAVVVISGQQEETLRQHGFRKNVEVIPFGVEPAMFEFQRKRASSPLRILHVANLTEVKDQATLIRGFALLKRHVDAVLRIVGPDYLNGRLQRLTAELGLEDRVEFVGAVSYATIPVHYRWADLFVLTSLCEAQNSALTEAAMSGVLLVSTPVGCIHDLGDDAAVIVRIGDPVDLAEKIRTIVKDPVEWQKKVALARAWAERHDLLWTVERLREVIDGVREWR